MTAPTRAARVRTDQLEFHPRNVRRDLGDLRELAASIAEVGVLEPLLVEDRPGRGRVLAGHRRLAAARMASVRTVPCLLVAERPIDDAIVIMVSENRHREALTAAEKTAAARTLRDEFGYTQTRIAKRLGVSDATVSKWLSGDYEEDRFRQQGAAEAPTREGLIAQAAERAEQRRADPPPPPKPRAPSIKAAEVHDLTARWSGKAPEPLLRELRGLLKGWQP